MEAYAASYDSEGQLISVIKNDIGSDADKPLDAEKPTNYSAMKLLIWKDSIPAAEVMELMSK